MNKPDQPMLLVGGQQKITDDHLQLWACIYVRQSSPKQVLHNRESQFNQYGLVNRAEALGWSEGHIRVIDTDQGLSAAGSEYRSGFQELVAEVSLGHVGIIFGYEVARLARNNHDWYQLLDLAALCGTLIADMDGVYDPRLYNDRLLLGLKGTMSEAELHLLRQRLDAGRLSQVRRGAYRQRLPTGLVRLPDGSVVKDPDDQVRHTLELVFAKFEELGSCRQVLRYLNQEQIKLPRLQTMGPYLGEILWKSASYEMVYGCIRNPAYAGAFAYGQRTVSPRRRQPGRPGTGRLHNRLPDDWIHVQKDIYPAYITWEQYLRNQEWLQQNATRYRERTQPAQGAAREGAGLLQGLVVCGECGYRMIVIYRANGPRYVCYELDKQLKRPRCASLCASAIDAVVVQAFFEAIRPAQLDALAAVLADQEAERERLGRQWTEQLKRAEYEAHLARRQYDAVDPGNRLVAAELERRWEEKLRQLQQTQEAYDRFRQTLTPVSLTPEMRSQLQRISERLPELWHSGQISNAQKKELLRSLIAKVVLKRISPDAVSIKIVWVSGHYSTLSAKPTFSRLADATGYDEMIAQIHTLWQQGVGDEEIAERLTAAGFRSARAERLLTSTVQRERSTRGWYDSLHQSRNALDVNGQLTVRGLAARLGVSTGTVYRNLEHGQIAPDYYTRHPQSQVYLFRDEPEVIEQLRRQVSPGFRAGGSRCAVAL